jgi:LAGLIDADG endonuclease
MKTGWIVYLQFGIGLHKKDRLLLESIKTLFGNVGNITEGNQKVQYRVSSIKDLEVIIEHFDNFPLITQKWSDYQLFKSASELVKCKKHLTQEGIEKIVSMAIYV